MKFTAKVTLPVGRIQKSFGIPAARKYMASQVRLRCDRYVPKDTGLLKDSAYVLEDGSGVVYPQSYAAKQFYWDYVHRDPVRGARWHERMLAAQGTALTQDVAAYIRQRRGAYDGI